MFCHLRCKFIKISKFHILEFFPQLNGQTSLGHFHILCLWKMNLASVSHILEPRDEQINDLPISLSQFGQFYNAHFGLSLEKLSVELPFHILPTSNGVPWQCCIPSECCLNQRVRKQSKLEMIEIFVVSQLLILHSESSNMLQGGLTIFSREQGEIKDHIPSWVGVLLVYHLWIRLVELRVANFPKA